MDTLVLKKRLSSFRSAKGSLTKVSDDVLMEILGSWESWVGTSGDFYKEIGVNRGQLGCLIKKAKKLRRIGHVIEGDFKEIKIEQGPSSSTEEPYGIVLSFPDGKRAHFPQVDQLVDFLKKIA